MSTINIVPARREEKNLVANLLQLYLHDFSEVEALETNAEGRFDYREFESFWGEPDHHVFLARYETRVVGFAFVQEGFYHEKDDKPDTQLIDMVEFFVLRRYRRKGVGYAMALHCFQTFPGRWQVRTDENNPGAVKFWERVIADFSQNRYETFHPVRFPGVTYYFESP
jgi:predicted acetyltransferase